MDTVLKILLSITVPASFLMIVFFVFGIKINNTESMPMGLYLRTDQETFHRDDIVNFVVPDNPVTQLQFSAAPYMDKPKYFLKVVYGVPGDVVTLKKDVAYVTAADGSCHIMPLNYKSILKSGVIPEGFIFVGTSHPQSFDSRYYGLINTRSITGVYKPLLTIGG